MGGARPMVDQGYRTAAQHGAAARERDARARAAAERHGIPKDSGRHLHRTEIDTVPVELRSGLLQDGDHDNQPADHHAADVRQPVERADLSDLCAEDRC